MESAARLIDRLKLGAHPEGGWYREVHRAAERVETARGSRSALTTIYYLLERQQKSRWHVVGSEEVWHFYAGAPLELLTYSSRTGAFRRHILESPGPEREPMGIVPAGVWQAARTLGEYSLVGCNVGPGFEFADFQLVSAVAGHDTHFTGDLARYAELL
jgi:predicted cupin superfamily sugar epimerase